MQRSNDFGMLLLQLIELLDGVGGARTNELNASLLQVVLGFLGNVHAPEISGAYD